MWLLLLAVVFLPLERLTALHPRKFFCKSLVSDIGFYFISGLIPGASARSSNGPRGYGSAPDRSRQPARRGRRLADLGACAGGFGGG